MISVIKVERKGNKVQVTFSDSTSIKLSSDVYKKFPVRVGENLDEKFLDLIKQENEYFEVKKSALRFLSVRSHSSQELYRKLLKKKFSSEIIEKVLSDLLSLGYLNDRKFAEQYFNELVGKLFGPLKIKNEMIKRGIAKEIIDEVLSDYFNNDEMQKDVVQKLLSKNKFPKKITNRNDLQKLYNHLISRGFSPEVVMECLRERFDF
jgi:regulatory protein